MPQANMSGEQSTGWPIIELALETSAQIAAQGMPQLELHNCPNVYVGKKCATWAEQVAQNVKLLLLAQRDFLP